ncbi:MAG: RNA methyltransferase [Cyanobacteria bacterium J083]|nr:MAG: RNA methyltransferase [Cyanobacteria bacterium J083]
MAEVKIVLVEPAGELNIGSVARIMKNMGLSQLILVNPQADPTSDEAKKMAVHAADILAKAEIVESLPQALEGCTRAIATTARSRSLPLKLESPRIALPWLLAENCQSALIFGPEERGLSNVELNYAQRFVAIPANPVYPSLNLAQAVAICAYELYQIGLEAENINLEEQTELDNCLGEKGRKPEPEAQLIATIDNLERYYLQLTELLLKIGYLYPHTSQARMEKLRRLYNRANLTAEELSMLQGMLRQINWAIENLNKL